MFVFVFCNCWLCLRVCCSWLLLVLIRAMSMAQMHPLPRHHWPRQYHLLLLRHRTRIHSRDQLVTNKQEKKAIVRFDWLTLFFSSHVALDTTKMVHFLLTWFAWFDLHFPKCLFSRLVNKTTGNIEADRCAQESRCSCRTARRRRHRSEQSSQKHHQYTYFTRFFLSSCVFLVVFLDRWWHNFFLQISV